MPTSRVFNAAQNQVLFSPVTNYYKGKAIRADIEYKENVNKQLEQEIEDAPSKKNRDQELYDLKFKQAEAALESAEIANGKETMDFMAKSLSDLTLKATEIAIAGDVEGATAGFNEDLQRIKSTFPPSIAEKVKSGAGEDGIYQIEEIANTKMMLGAWLKREGADRVQSKFLVDGKAFQGSFDKAGNYYYSDGKPVLGKITPVAPQATQDDLSLTGDKSLDREIVKSEVASRNLVDLIDRTILQIDAMPQSGMGLTGKVVRGLDEIAAELTGIYEVIGGTETIDGKEVPVGSLLDPGLYEWTGKLANASAAVKSNHITMSYLKARAMEPGGRLAKDDVRLARDSLGGDWASKGKMKTALNETAWQAINGLKNYYKATGNIGKFPKDLSEKMDKLKPSTFSTGVVPDDYDGPTAIGANGELFILNEDGTDWIVAP